MPIDQMSTVSPFELSAIPSQLQQGLDDGLLVAVYCAGATALRDFMQPLGCTAFKLGMTCRRYVEWRPGDLGYRKYASIVADSANPNVTLLKHPLGNEWFLAPLGNRGSDEAILALLDRLPDGKFDDGVITFRMPSGVDLKTLEQRFQAVLLPRNLNTFLSSDDGHKRLKNCGYEPGVRLYTDYFGIGRKPRRSLASELFLFRPQREPSVVLSAIIVALEQVQPSRKAV